MKAISFIRRMTVKPPPVQGMVGVIETLKEEQKKMLSPRSGGTLFSNDSIKGKKNASIKEGAKSAKKEEEKKKEELELLTPPNFNYTPTNDELDWNEEEETKQIERAIREYEKEYEKVEKK